MENLTGLTPHSKRAFFEQLDLMHPALSTGVPIRISQAKQDPRVSAERIDVLQKELAELNRGVTVLYEEYEEVSPTHDPKELGFHFGLMETDAPQLTGWLEEQFLMSGGR